MIYSQEVVEIRHYRVRYSVVADSKEEADEKLRSGETEDEEEIEFVGVVDRVPQDDIEEYEDDDDLLDD